jgi:hypothetical protein
MDPDNSDGSTYSASISTGKIKFKGGFSISSPGVGDVYRLGQQDVAIVWTKGGDISSPLFNNVEIAFSDDPNPGTFDGNKVVIAASVNLADVCTGDTCTYLWDVTQDLAISQKISQNAVYYLRVREPDDSADTYSISANQFRLRGDLAIQTPAVANTIYKTGEAVTITWTKAGDPLASNVLFDDVLLSYSTDPAFATKNDIGTYNLTAKCTGDTCTHSWTVPDDTVAKITGSAVYYFRVTEPTDTTNATKSVSGNKFQIRGDLLLGVLNGAGNETYEIGDTWTITWTKKGQANTVPDPD